MSDLTAIQEQLQDTVATLAALEKDIAHHPDVPALLLNYQSIDKRRKKLEAELSATAAARRGRRVRRQRALRGDN